MSISWGTVEYNESSGTWYGFFQRTYRHNPVRAWTVDSGTFKTELEAIEAICRVAEKSGATYLSIQRSHRDRLGHVTYGNTAWRGSMIGDEEVAA